MPPFPTQLTLELKPQTRYQVIDITRRILDSHGDILKKFKNTLYCSFHTTAGFLEEDQSAALRYRIDRVSPFIGSFQRLFPPNANYRHDQLQLRTELTEAERKVEPKNADSHLVFISAGMKNCVTYKNRLEQPVYFIDLDGINGNNGNQSHCRKTAILVFNHEQVVHKAKMDVPVSKHPIDSINLNDPDLEFMAEINDLIQKLGIRHGKIDIQLGEKEMNAGLTVNEYETMLMKNDLAEVLHNPLKYMAIKGKHALAAPKLIPEKTLNYAKYDLVHVFNVLMDSIGLSETFIEKCLSLFLRLPASHFLGMKRHISLFVSEESTNGNGRVVFGKYQSPILVQWRSTSNKTRRMDVTISEFK